MMDRVGQRSSDSKHVVGAQEETRTRVVSAALKLLNDGGVDAVTTRAVAELAGVQPPILYRLFTDKAGLLNALSEYGFALYLGRKRASQPTEDPVKALQTGWDRHVDFGLSHPSLYLLMYAVPPTRSSTASDLSFAMLKQHIVCVAAAGRLAVPEEQATVMYHAAAVGTVLTLLRSHESSRDPRISHTMRDNTLSIITGDKTASLKQSPIALAATTLDAAVSAEDGFSPAEFALFKEWIGRLKSR